MDLRGGTRCLIEMLLSDERLEVLEAALTDQIGYDSDLLGRPHRPGCAPVSVVIWRETIGDRRTLASTPEH